MLEIRVCMQYPKSKQIARPNTRHKSMQIDNTMHTCTPRVSSTCCLENGHVTHVEYLGKTKTKQKIIVPR